jgi:hypothetical protein
MAVYRPKYRDPNGELKESAVYVKAGAEKRQP